MEKTTHAGRAGEYAAMSEFLLRGYNIAIPVVDVGDDAFVIDDRDRSTWRVQVKTVADDGSGGASRKTHYTLSRAQLRFGSVTELFFMFMIRWGQRWRFVLIDRASLSEIRDSFVERGKTQKKPGRKPKDDSEAGDALALEITWTEDDAKGWGASFKSYLDSWPSALPPIKDGPGSKTPAPSR